MGGSLRLVVAAADGAAASSVVTEIADLAHCGQAAASVPADTSGGELAGCRGVPIAPLLPAHVDTLAHPTAVIITADGLATAPISLADLRRGVIVHSCPDASPLPPGMGGPLRAWFPGGAAPPPSTCGEGPHWSAAKNVAEIRVRSTDSAAAILFDADGRALILQRGPTAPWMPLAWNLPGGGIDAGETAAEAAVREAQEEAGLTPRAPRLLAELEYAPGRLVAVFVGDSHSGALGVNWESCAHAWVGVAQLPGYAFVPAVEDALRRAFGAREEHARARVDVRS